MEPMETRVHPYEALAVYAESLAAGAHVVVFGDASLGLAERLLALDARSVQVWDPLPGHARPAHPPVRSYSAFEASPRGAGVAIVPDLGLFDDPALLVARVRDLVGPDGVALIVAANREAPAPGETRTFDYYELFDLVAGDFASVRMVAQLPFEGVAFVTLGDADDAQAVSVDPTLADGDRAPAAFIAVASQSDAALDPYAIVELPARPAWVEVDDGPATPRPSGDEEAARLRIDALEAKLVGEGARFADLEARAATLLAEQEVRGSALLSDQEVRAAARFADLEARAGARLADLEARLALRDREVAELSAHAEGLADRARAAVAALEPMAARLDDAEARAAKMQELLSRSGDSHATELGRYEDALRERAHALRELEAEVARRERIVRELVGALEEAAAPVVVSAAEAVPTPISATADALAAANEAANAAAARAAAATQALGEASAENARLRQQLDALALEVARREGEAQATMWTVSELERRLSANDAPPAAGAGNATEATADEGDLGAALAAAQDQLDALRQALAQEHDARIRAESGEELARARAEIRRLETLIPG
jgi:hypothetical protein